VSSLCAVVPLFAVFIIIELFLLTGATCIAYAAVFSSTTNRVSLVAVIIMGGSTLFIVLWMTSWNQSHNYVDHVRKHVEEVGDTKKWK